MDQEWEMGGAPFPYEFPPEESPMMMRLGSATAFVSALLLAGTIAVAAKPGESKTVDRLEVFPKSLTLNSVRDTRRLLVTGIAADGSHIDLSDAATLKVDKKIGRAHV